MKSRASLVLLIIGLLVVAAGLQLQIKPLVSLAWFGLGLFGLVSGLRMIVTRRADVPQGNRLVQTTERHTGFSAQLWGVLFIAFGLLAMGFGGAVWLPPGLLEAWFGRLFDTTAGWGVLLVVIGVPVVLYSLTRLLASSSAFAGTAHRNPFARVLSGCYYGLIGLVLVAVGALLIADPGLLARLAEQLLAFLLRLASR
jgi:hypothetical protein